MGQVVCQSSTHIEGSNGPLHYNCWVWTLPSRPNTQVHILITHSFDENDHHNEHRCPANWLNWLLPASLVHWHTDIWATAGPLLTHKGLGGRDPLWLLFPLSTCSQVSKHKHDAGEDLFHRLSHQKAVLLEGGGGTTVFSLLQALSTQEYGKIHQCMYMPSTGFKLQCHPLLLPLYVPHSLWLWSQVHVGGGGGEGVHKQGDFPGPLYTVLSWNLEAFFQMEGLDLLAPETQQAQILSKVITFQDKECNWKCLKFRL